MQEHDRFQPLFEPLPCDESDREVTLRYFFLTSLHDISSQRDQWRAILPDTVNPYGKRTYESDLLHCRLVIEELEGWTKQREIVATDVRDRYPDQNLVESVLLHADPTADEVSILSAMLTKDPKDMTYPEICYMISLLSLSQRENEIPDPLAASASTSGGLVAGRPDKAQFVPRERLRHISAYRMNLSHQETYAKARAYDGYVELAVSDRALRGLRAKELLLKELPLQK